MSPTECADQNGPMAAENQPSPSEPDPATKLLKRLIVGFAVTVTVGLTLAGWYVSGRIVAAEQPAAASAAESSVAAEPPQPVEQPHPLAQAIQQAASPQTVKLYLEVAALGSKQDLKYLRQLEAKGYQARIEIASSDAVGRILIGPYAERAALEKAQRKLAASGILAMESAF